MKGTIMAELFSGEIYIGGKIPRSKLPGLIQAINKQQCCWDWGDSTIELGDEIEPAITELLKRIEDTGQELLWLCDDDARYGELEIIENFCLKNDIGFRRFSEGCGDYSPEIAEFRPEWEGVDDYVTDSNGNPMIPGTDVKLLLDALDSAEEDFLEDEQKKFQIVGLRENVQNLLPRKVDELEPFEIID